MGGMPGMGGPPGMPGMGGMPSMPPPGPGGPGAPPMPGPPGMPNMGGMDMGKMGGGKMGGKGDGKGAPGPMLGQFSGTIKGFNPKQGRGFISCPDLAATGQSGEVFLNHEELGEFEVGAQVSFTAFLNANGQPEAKDLEAGHANKMQRLM